MKVTDEMWVRFTAHLEQPMPTLRDALEAALADVPEPSVQDQLLRSSMKAHYEAVRRVNAAEAKLAKVRAWAERDTEREDVLAILDEP